MEIPANLRNILAQRCDPPMSEEERAKNRADVCNADFGKLNEITEYDCKHCRNKGYVAVPVEKMPGVWDVDFQTCRCIKVRESIRNMEKSGLKNLIKSYTFDSFTVSEPWQEKIKSAAISYASSATGWFFIGGQSGSGKTHICTAICREFLLSGKAVQYMLWRDEIVKLKAAVNDAELYKELIDRFKRVKVLYIDDLFKTGKSDREPSDPTAADINIAFEILNYRYNDSSLLTVISSELTVPEILSIDEALGGRIYERSSVNTVERNSSKNFRLKGKDS